MARTDLSLPRRIGWLVSGRVAATIEERYEDAADAVLFPSVAVVVTVAVAIPALDHWGTPGGLVTLGTALLLGLIAAEAILASVWYYVDPHCKEVQTHP